MDSWTLQQFFWIYGLTMALAIGAWVIDFIKRKRRQQQ